SDWNGIISLRQQQLDGDRQTSRKALVIRLNLSDLPNRKIGNIKNKWCTGRFEIDVTNEPDLDENLAFPVDQKDCLI
ncbi:unnamed protein product, partial [Porites lobata]